MKERSILAGERVRDLEPTFWNHLDKQLTVLYSAESIEVQGQRCYRVINSSYLTRFNKQHDEIVGHSVAELIGQTIFETMIKDCLDQCFAGQTVQYEDWFDYPTMGLQFMSVTYNPYIEPDQSIFGAVVTVRNLTETGRNRPAQQ